MKKIVAFSPADERNLKYFAMLEKSFHKFHPDIELLRFDNPNPQDKDFWYRATPIIGSKLLEEYETVLKLDSDQVILSPLTDIIEDTDKYSVGVVLNDPTYPIQVWDITHPRIYNNGLVVMKNKEFVDHWKRLCFSSHFQNYQYREQDLLCLLTSDYFNYTVKILDGLKVYGEWAKPLWTQAYLKDDKVVIPVNGQEIELCVYHSGGGNAPDKMNYHLRFKPEVASYISKLIT